MLKESAIAVNNAGGGNVGGIDPNGIPPAETALGRMRRCAEKHRKKHKKKHKKKHNISEGIASAPSASNNSAPYEEYLMWLSKG